MHMIAVVISVRSALPETAGPRKSQIDTVIPDFRDHMRELIAVSVREESSVEFSRSSIAMISASAILAQPGSEVALGLKQPLAWPS